MENKNTMVEEVFIQSIINEVAEIIAKINKSQEEHFIEDLDYLKLHLCNACNYKEILAEEMEVKE